MDSALLFTIVQYRMISLNMAVRAWETTIVRPKITTSDDNIAKAYEMVLDDRRIKMREIAEVIKMFKKGICHILI